MTESHLLARLFLIQNPELEKKYDKYKKDWL